MNPKQKAKGNVALEFALILPVLLLFVGGIIDLGRAYWFKQTLTWASREGARYGSVLSSEDWSCDFVKERVIQAVQKGCGTSISKDDVAVVPEAGPKAASELTVTVSMPFRFLILPYSIPNLSGQTTMRFESS
jgi:Flp pilus assembly protein TadG|uniref:Pilus assembly protein n=1 Tax=Desulfobacca acetoxidans TaxID=60893 RepID=A0A7C5EP61_9BACT